MKKARLICISLLFISLGGLIPTGFGAASASDPLDNWTIIDNVTNKNLNGIAYGNGTFVAVGGIKVEEAEQGATPYGIILTSQDGVNWNDKTPEDIIVPLFKVAYGNGTFVASGGIVESGDITNPKILYSKDNGNTWTESNLKPKALINAIAFASGIFVAADVHFAAGPSSLSPDGHSTLYTSPDGINWQKRTSTLGAIINAIAYGNGVWIAMGAHYDESLDKEDCKIFFSSNNGQTWRATTGQFVVLHNKLGWPYPTDYELLYGKQSIFGNGLFWGIPQDQVGGHGLLINSSDGINWNEITLTTSLTTYDRFNSIAYGSGFFMVVGEEGILLTSALGGTWRPRISGTINELRDVVFGNDTFVAVAYGGIIIQSGPIVSPPPPGPGPISKRKGESNHWNFSGGLAAVKVGDAEWGFINKRGKMALNPVFDDTLGFSGGLGAVTVSGEVGYINKNGKQTIAPQYSDAKNFSEGLAAVNTGEKWGFINPNGTTVIEPQFDDAWSFSESLAAVKIGNKVGFITRWGRILIIPQYDDGLDFSENYAAVSIEGKWGFINKRGLFFGPFDDAWSFSEGLAPVALNGKWGFVNNNIAIAIQPQFDSTLQFSEGFAGVEVGAQWGFINSGGTIVITLQYDAVQSFSGGLAGVKSNGKWGFIDNSGSIVIEPQFDNVLAFSQGLAAVTIGGKVGYINTQGVMVIQPQFDMPGSF